MQWVMRLPEGWPDSDDLVLSSSRFLVTELWILVSFRHSGLSGRAGTI